MIAKTTIAVLWILTLAGLFSMSNGATAISTLSHTDCSTCYNSASTRPCLSDTFASYCCASTETSTECNYCGDTTSSTPRNWIYCPFVSSVCGSETLTGFTSPANFVSLAVGETCVYKIVKTYSKSELTVKVSGDGFDGYLAYGPHKGSTEGFHKLTKDEEW